jgi:hypothetical protein
MRRAARRDDNEKEVIAALREAGAYVKQINDKGLFDLLVAYTGPSGREHVLLLEVKDGSKPPSARRLTDAEAKFHEEWPLSNLFIVISAEHAVALLKTLP